MITVAPVPALDPTSYAPGSSPHQPTLPLGTGTIVAGPDRLLDLVRPVTLEGTMTADPSNGLVKLQTILGTLTIQPDAALQMARAVVAQIVPGTPPTITILPQQNQGPQTVRPAISAELPVLPQAAIAAQPPAVGQMLTLVPIPPDAKLPYAVAHAPNPAAATQVSAQLAAITTPQPPAARTISETAAMLFAAARPMAATPAQAKLAGTQFASLIEAQEARLPDNETMPHALPASVPISAQAAPTAPHALAARIVAIIPPGEPPMSPPAGMTTGAITGATLGSQPILQTASSGNFVLQAAGSLPQGTQIVFETVARPAATVPVLPLDIATGKSWPALTQALQTLTTAQPALAEAVRLAIPHAGPLLAPLLTQFIGNQRSEGAKSWLGEKILDALRHAGRSDLSEVLNTDFANVDTKAATPSQEGWRTIPIPFFFQGELERLQLYMRPYPHSDDHDETAEAQDRTGTRFLIDVAPRAVGPIQLDGLVRSDIRVGNKMLDLILRSRTPLTLDMKRDIARLFADSIMASGLKGGIIFQGANNWVVPDGGRRNRQAAIA